MNASQVTTTIANLRRANNNVFIPEIRLYSDAWYVPRPAHYTSYGPSATIYSHGVPMQIDLGSEAEPRKSTTFDHLGDIITKAHTGPKRLDVWAWLVSFRTGPVMRGKHPEWLTWNSDGVEITEDFDPGHPGAVQQLVNVCKDIATNYDVDGLNFDYIRFTDAKNGYNPVSVARFNARYGRTGTPDNSDPLWKQWRRDQVTNAVRKIYLNVIAINPNIKISADTITWAPGPNRPSPSDPNPHATWKANFERQTSAFNSVYQDWRSWMEEGILDISLPMNYFRECTHPADYDKWSDFTKENQFNRQGMIGPGTYLNSLDGALDQLARTRLPSQPNGITGAGQAVYVYAAPYASACGGNLVYDPDGMCTALSSGTPSRPTPLYPTYVPVPELPRLTNGKGHLMGTITRSGSPAPGWIDGATITLTGPVTRTARTDGTGFYGFVDLPPGTYSLTAAADGVNSKTGSVTVTAHNVKAQNITLSSGAAPYRTAFAVSPDSAISGSPFGTQPIVHVLDVAGQLAMSYDDPVTLSLKPGTGNPAAVLTGATTANAVSGVATFTDVGVSLPGAGYVLLASSGGLNVGESAPFDVTAAPAGGLGYVRIASLPNASGGTGWSLSGLGVNKNPGSPYYGYVYLTNRLSGANRVQIVRPDPASAGASASRYVDTERYIQMGDTGLNPWDASVGSDDTVWMADLGGRRIYSAPPVPPTGQTSINATLQASLTSVSNTGGPRGLTATGPVTDARIYTAWYTDSRAQIVRVQAPDASTTGTSEITWSGTLGYASGPYSVAVDPAGNAYYPKNMPANSTASVFYKVGPDGAEQPFTAALPAWAATSALGLQGAAFAPDPDAPGGGYLHYSASVTVGGAKWVVVHRFAMNGTWLDGFGPAMAGAPASYTAIEIPASTVSTVAYIDADDRGNIYALGMVDGANAVVKVARLTPVGFADAQRALLIAAGLAAADALDMARLNVADSGSQTVDLADAVALARRAAGLDTAP